MRSYSTKRPIALDLLRERSIGAKENRCELVQAAVEDRLDRARQPVTCQIAPPSVPPPSLRHKARRSGSRLSVICSQQSRGCVASLAQDQEFGDLQR
jgi:hypothetical protein